MSNDTLINADLWDEEPKIFTANYAFEGIEGIEGTTQEAIEAAGGAWVQDVPARCSQVVFPVRTSAQTPSGVANGWGWPTYQANGMPIVFSWPVKASTVNNTDFLITLNTGEQVFPDVVSLNPNAVRVSFSFCVNSVHVSLLVVVCGRSGTRDPPLSRLVILATELLLEHQVLSTR